ncbi:MAG: ABC transporter ATP-binding protein [Lachnospiraceae bacterium]|nr:ABC transporter ATP-binding protein [Lachnospiraceae bacterium]
MLEAKQIRFRYGHGGFQLGETSLKLEKGYVYVLYGENGSGKTTLLKLLYGMLEPSSGEIFRNGERVTGKKLAAFHREAAYVGAEWCVSEATLADNVEFLRTLYPTFEEAYFQEILERFRMDGADTRRMMEYSAGERCKAEIAFALARRPKLLLLDEPLANLDPVCKAEVIDILQRAIAASEMTVLMSTNLIDEVREIADYTGSMRDGQLSGFNERGADV